VVTELAGFTRKFNMTNKSTMSGDTKKEPDVSHPGMMGDGTEEQNLDELGNPAARIKKMRWKPFFWKEEPTERINSRRKFWWC
jgi:hypothetical protein